MSVSNYQIRKALHGDEKAIHDVHMYSIMNVCVHEHGAEEVSGWGQRPFDENKWFNAIEKHHVWVVEDQYTQAIKGMACLILNMDNDKDHADLAALYFHPDIIGMGFGRKVFDTMVELCRKNLIAKIQMESSLTALGFYKKMGFIPTGPLQKDAVGGSMVSCIPMALGI